jgi:arylsulfatase A-like enzyme
MSTFYRLAIVLVGLWLSGAPAGRAGAAAPPNVLFIAVDDLRPELGCFGHEGMHTPHLDRLAEQGRVFRRHYVQVPTCGASRGALLTGRYPRSRQDLSNDAIRRHMAGRDEPAQPESFAHHFRRGGYTTICLGKISHYPDGRLFAYDHSGEGDLEMPHSWDRVGLPYGPWENGWDAFFGYAGGAGRVQGQSPPIESADVPDEGYPDGLIAGAAIEALQKQQRQLAEGGRPFLLCVGFFKPHLPFCAPQKYFDLYDLEEIAPPANPESPAGVNSRSIRQSGEPFGNYRHASEQPREDVEHHQRLRQAYFACVSYVDAQIGRVLSELDRLGLAENTVVVVWGDHGWHLGEHHLWGKHTTFERALHSPLIVRTPGMPAPGKASDGLVESVDLYPTLTELCGLTPPDDLDGTSMVPLLEVPAHAGKPAYGFWPGRTTVRTDRYRLVAYTEPQADAPQFELFDHQRDPLETTNVAADHPDVVERLLSLIAPRVIR